MPEFIQECLKTWFNFPHSELFCQVATLYKDQPRLRTMKLYNITKKDELVLITRTQTRKWTELKHCQKIAICLLHPDAGQILVEGSAILKTLKSHSEEVKPYWEALAEEWQDYYRKMGMPDSFGMIFVTTYRWEVLQISRENYQQSIRKEFVIKNDKWIEHNLNPE